VFVGQGKEMGVPLKICRHEKSSEQKGSSIWRRSELIGQSDLKCRGKEIGGREKTYEREESENSSSLFRLQSGHGVGEGKTGELGKDFIKKRETWKKWTTA